MIYIGQLDNQIHETHICLMPYYMHNTTVGVEKVLSQGTGCTTMDDLP